MAHWVLPLAILFVHGFDSATVTLLWFPYSTCARGDLGPVGRLEPPSFGGGRNREGLDGGNAYGLGDAVREALVDSGEDGDWI